MRITFRYMAQLRQAAGLSEETIESDAAGTLTVLLAQLVERHGDAYRRILFDDRGAIHPSMLFFLGDEQVRPDQTLDLRDGAVVTVMAPMAGGSPVARRQLAGRSRSKKRDQLPVNHRLPDVYRFARDDIQGTAHGESARDAPLAWVEAALLAADEPLPARKLAAVAGVDDALAARRLVRKLHSLYEQEGSAFQIEELAGGFQLLTRPEFHPWLMRFRRSSAELRLTPAARETLTIIAYRQPITRADIEAVRGVHCGDVLRFLMEKGLVRIAGRHDSLGRPVLYGTTKKFLQLFGLKSVKDLPSQG